VNHAPKTSVSGHVYQPRTSLESQNLCLRLTKLLCNPTGALLKVTFSRTTSDNIDSSIRFGMNSRGYMTKLT
jgi:hypothetical protein